MMKYYSAKNRNEVPIYAITQLRRYLFVAPFCSYFYGLFNNFTIINLVEYYLICLGFLPSCIIGLSVLIQMTIMKLYYQIFYARNYPEQLPISLIL